MAGRNELFYPRLAVTTIEGQGYYPSPKGILRAEGSDFRSFHCARPPSPGCVMGTGSTLRPQPWAPPGLHSGSFAGRGLRGCPEGEK